MPSTPFTFVCNSILLLGLSASAFGSTVYLASSASETGNNSGSATINIPANSSWSSAFSGTSWVGESQSGKSSKTGYVTFTDTFTVDGAPTFSDLLMMTDDKSSVSLNGVLLTNSLSKCSHLAIGYTSATEGLIDLTNALRSGSNTLTITIEKLDCSPIGLDYSGVVYSSQVSSSTPEPGTLLLFGVPLAVLGILRRRKLKLKA